MRLLCQPQTKFPLLCGCADPGKGGNLLRTLPGRYQAQEIGLTATQPNFPPHQFLTSETKTLHPPKKSFFSHTLWKNHRILFIPPRGVSAQDTQGQPSPALGRRPFFRERGGQPGSLQSHPAPPSTGKQRTWIQESRGPQGLASEWRKVKAPGWGRGTEWCWAKPHAGEREGGGLCCGLGSIPRSQ